MIRITPRKLRTATAVLAVVFIGALPLAGSARASRSHASVTTVGSITLSPQAITIVNPSTLHGSAAPRHIPVTLSALDAQGNPITGGTFAQPITISIYQPASSPLSMPTRTITAPTSTVFFNYNGHFFSNAIVVSAVSGTQFAEMVFLPTHTGFASTRSVRFRIPNTRNRNFRNGWGFSASIGGGPRHYVQMDTGSRGLVVPASAIGPGAIGPGAPGKIEYTSDGKIFTGHYFLTPVKLIGPGVSVTTVPIQVLGVQHGSCDPKYPQCVPSPNIGGLVGVGFNRGGTTVTLPVNINNVFLSLSNIIQGTMHPGYIITANSVSFGITHKNTAGYKLIKLKPNTVAAGDWLTEQGCFGFPQITGYGALCGTMLVDTGINSMILDAPTAQRPPGLASGAIPKGVAMQISAPTAAGSAMSYGFVSGDRGSATPTSIRWGGTPTVVFINTGRNPISKFDYLFDAGSGWLGFKPVS